MGNCLDYFSLRVKLSDIDYIGRYPMLWFGVGISVVGSQISRIMHHLPDLPCINIDDKEGEMGIILGLLEKKDYKPNDFLADKDYLTET